MSGIAGIFYLDNRPVEPSDLSLMVRAIAYRGPDGSGTWSDGPIGLCHLAMHTTPESLREQLPLAYAARNLVITADARIDNRDVLLAARDCGDRRHSEISDAELILAAYERWGEECPAHLLGDFAFAIWDGRNGRLFCARDHFGVRPFYYYRRGPTFIFASEIKAILSLSQVPRRVNEVRIADYLLPLLEDKVSTLYEDIYRLPAAHSFAIGPDKARVHSYWVLDPRRETRFDSSDQYAEHFRELFFESVRCRLRGVGPVGSTLSGGMDSSAISCVAGDILGRENSGPLHTFSGVYDDVPSCDESPYIKAVLAKGGFEPHFVHPDRLSPFGSLDAITGASDEPVWNPQIALHRSLYQSAGEQKVCVLLYGHGGDAVVSYDPAYLTQLADTGRWWAFLQEAWGIKRNFGIPVRKTLINSAVRPLSPGYVRRLWRLLHGTAQADAHPDLPLRRDFVERIGLAEREVDFERRYEPAPRTLRHAQWLELTSGLEQFSFESIDRSAAMCYIEPRYPFYDQRLVEFCLGLPGEQQMYRGLTRVIVRNALSGLLPDEVLTRGGKANLGQSFEVSMYRADRAVLNSALEGSETIYDYVDKVRMRQAYERYLSQHGSFDPFLIWRVALVALWLQRLELT